MCERQLTVMILGGGQLQVPIIQCAKKRGYKVIVVSPDKKQPGVSYADEVVELDVCDEQGVLDAAKKYSIDGITTDQTDLPVRTAAYVAEKMGISGIGYEKGCLFTDKFKQRELCKELELLTPKYILTSSLAQAEKEVVKIGFPAIIKPVDSQASHGVAKVNNIDELRENYQNALDFSKKGKGVLIEQFIEGTEFPVDSYVIDGKCTLMSIGQYNPFEIKDVFSSYKTVWPAKQPKDVLNLIETTNKKIVEGFGLKTGRTHAEYIVSENKCYLVEIGARGGGSFFSSDDIRFVTGISSEDFLLDFAVGKNVTPCVHKDETYFCCCTLFFYLPEKGIVQSIDGVDDVLSREYVFRNNIDSIYIGMHTKDILDKGSRMFLVIVADSYNQLEERIEDIRNTLRISTLTANGEECMPIWK